MTSIGATAARSKLYQLLDEAADSHEPIKIIGKRSKAVLLSEEDWRGTEGTAQPRIAATRVVRAAAGLKGAGSEPRG